MFVRVEELWLVPGEFGVHLDRARVDGVLAYERRESSYSYTSTGDVITYRRVRPVKTRRAISAWRGVSQTWSATR
jgi:hypothetical protein